MKSRFLLATACTLAIVTNLAITAHRVQAALTDATCYDSVGEPVDCCKPCLFFCDCTIIE